MEKMRRPLKFRFAKTATDLGDEESAPALGRPADGDGVQRRQRAALQAALRQPQPEGRPRCVAAPLPQEHQRREEGEGGREEEAAAVHPLAAEYVRHAAAQDHRADLAWRASGRGGEGNHN